MKGTRQISHVTLADRLRQFERAGVAVPALYENSLYKSTPHYVGMKGNVELYQLGAVQLEVRPSEVIDSFGNIVDLERLERAVYLAELRKLQDRIYLGDFP